MESAAERTQVYGETAGEGSPESGIDGETAGKGSPESGIDGETAGEGFPGSGIDGEATGSAVYEESSGNEPDENAGNTVSRDRNKSSDETGETSKPETDDAGGSAGDAEEKAEENSSETEDGTKPGETQDIKKENTPSRKVTEVPDEKAVETLNRADVLRSKRLDILEETIDVPGVNFPVDVVFCADSHISLCDERDMALKFRADMRYSLLTDKRGRTAEKTFNALLEYTEWEKPDLLILGGDILDSAMYASVDFLQSGLLNLSVPYIYSLGNHDFEYGAEYFTPAAYDLYRPRVLGISKSESGVHTVDLGEMYVFAVDDFNSQYSPGELEAFKEIYDDGKPILFVSHVPLEPAAGNREFYYKSIELYGTDALGHSKVMIGDGSCVPDAVTRQMTDLILAENSPVFCVLSGHVHYEHEDMLNDSILQISTGAGFESKGVLLHIR
ncbi:MAG: metallophosphoesterase [Lachnospiraceae bacterium]|nr:metallophosphoesterase [Lachnospiraceae bacterium]